MDTQSAGMNRHEMGNERGSQNRELGKFPHISRSEDKPGIHGHIAPDVCLFPAVDKGRAPRRGRAKPAQVVQAIEKVARNRLSGLCLDQDLIAACLDRKIDFVPGSVALEIDLGPFATMYKILMELREYEALKNGAAG